MTMRIETTPSKWLSPQQAAAYLGCSRNFLDKARLSRLHAIPYCRLGRHVRYLASDLDDWLKSSKTTLAKEGHHE